MCGIAGAVGDIENRLALVHGMAERLRHRGPDEGGTFDGPTCSMAMRRLSIIDLAGGSQPLYNESRDIAVICNGEIYNFQQLRHELEHRGHVFRTGSDVEVLAHGYEAWGEDILARLNGMFALALWDARSDRLLLARDRLGKKPLYYVHKQGRLVFASELRALLGWPAEWTVDRAACQQFCARGYFPGAATPFLEIRRLLPGHAASFDGRAFELRRYWRPAPEPLRGDRSTAAGALHSLLQDAVRLRLISDVPVGAFLSGGLDSSLVVAIAAGELSARIPTFSVTFPGYSHFDESRHAAQVAKHFGCEHHEIPVDASSFDDVAATVWALDEPLADPAALPTLLLSRLAKSKVTVVLTGEGADEVFGGYDRYRLSLRGAILAGRLPPLSAAASMLLRFRRRRAGDDSRWSRILRAASEGGQDPVEWSRSLARVPGLAPAWMTRNGDSEFVADAPVQAGHRLAPVQIDDLTSLLPDSLLTKVDRMTMAASLEARCPFLDYRLVEFGLGLPDSWKVGLTTSKVLLRAVAKDLLPESIRRRAKHTFRVPLGQWLRGPLAPLLAALTANRQLESFGIVSSAAVGKIVNAHMTARADFGRALWALVTLDLWLQQATMNASLKPQS